MADVHDIVLYLGLVAIAAVAVHLSIIDLRTHRLPNRLVGPLALGVAMWLMVLAVTGGDIERGLIAMAWGCLAVAVFFVLHLTAGLGMGDVKYAWPIAATLGWWGWTGLRAGLVGLAIASIIATVVFVVRRVPGKRRVAYGPYMSVGLVFGSISALL